jgi:hypothetical protein
MFKQLLTAFKETLFFIGLALKALRFWHRDPPLQTPIELMRFVETRCKWISQTTLIGYVKTRAGTRYTSLFADDLFAKSLNIAKWEIYLACLNDMSIYATSAVGSQTDASEEELSALALYIFETALSNDEIPVERPQGFDDVREIYKTRVTDITWGDLPGGEFVFGGSLDALFKWAPIADELKQYDTEPVKNSMRFKWKRLRDIIGTILEADSVMAQWRDGLKNSPS